MSQLKLPTLLIIGIWMGMLIGLSFIEAPLKFTAPNMTTKLGLGIGRIMFNVLNKSELVFSSLLIIFGALATKSFRSLTLLIIFGTLLTVVVLQTVWFLPALDARADRVLNDIANPPSHLHIVYVICEFVKLALLLILFKLIYKNG